VVQLEFQRRFDDDAVIEGAPTVGTRPHDPDGGDAGGGGRICGRHRASFAEKCAE
jgi:hypothetical protein